MCDDGNSVFQAKKQYLYSKIWEFGGEWGQGIKISSRKCNLTSPILICLFTMHLVLGILLSIFRRKKTNKVQCVLGPNLTVFEDK